MSQQELLKRVIQVLTTLGIDYMVTGSVASSIQGEPRSTHDIDLVVDLTPQAGSQLAQAFPPPDFYLPQDAIGDAFRQRSMFNLLCVISGDKVDFWLLTDEPFDRSRFQRKRAEDVLGMRLYVSTPEDTILAKLRWAQLSGGSEKQFTDALRVLEVHRGKLDQDYLNRWARTLAVEDLWQQLQADAEPL
jgi:hypothetical protein